MAGVRVPFRIVSQDGVAAEFERAWGALRELSPGIVFSHQTFVDVKTAFAEAAANVIKHARELDRRGFIEGTFFIDHKRVGFEVVDHGPGFDIDAIAVPDLFDMKASGRGIFIMKQVGDEVRYRRGRERNLLIFRRYLVGQSASTREIDLLYNLSEAAIRGAGLDELCEMILDQALTIFHVERASILVYDDALKRLKVVASRGMSGEVRAKTRVRSGEGVSGYVFRHGRPLLIEDIDKNRRGIEKKDGYKSGSFISAPMICSPLRFGERPLGVINLTDRADGRHFTKKDLKVLSTIANQAMACMHVRDLMGEARDKEALKREVEIVREIQSSYLPQTAPSLHGLDLAGRCAMAANVGGDYFDYFRAGDDILYLVVADVSGHDMKSALTMFNFRSQLRVLLDEGLDPAQILSRLARTMNDDLERAEQFVSVLLIRFDAVSGDYELASAGHYPPLFFPDRYELVPSGLPLGIARGERYENVRGALASGEGFLLFTDGVVEAMNPKGSFFGIDRLRALAATLSSQPAEQIVGRVIDDVLGHRDKAAPQDDVTAVVLKRKTESGS